MHGWGGRPTPRRPQRTDRTTSRKVPIHHGRPKNKSKLRLLQPVCLASKLPSHGSCCAAHKSPRRFAESSCLSIHGHVRMERSPEALGQCFHKRGHAFRRLPPRRCYRRDHPTLTSAWLAFCARHRSPMTTSASRASPGCHRSLTLAATSTAPCSLRHPPTITSASPAPCGRRDRPTVLLAPCHHRNPSNPASAWCRNLARPRPRRWSHGRKSQVICGRCGHH
mmetsp:Transcript_92471/g.261222  ORF Transcript_92471/g.261222 Transcript_92471/m.261222 type:complete len:223 (+) Transcript_92471:2050-2718(+)